MTSVGETVGGNRKASKGAVACGHPGTAEAVREILEDGGNAFDGALAGFWAATVAEPVLCSLGGGGFLMARPAESAPCLYDFFVQTPHRRRPADELDFFPILADFGTATQEFHIGLGSTATPGAIKGLFEVHQDLASLPMQRLAEPAVRLAREGFQVREIDAYVYRVISPVLMAGTESKAVFSRPDGTLHDAGDHFAQPKLADTMEALAREGEQLFYAGELGRLLVAACREGGGQLTRGDLAAYQVKRRAPLERRYRGARILTNPPPSSGGILIAFALELLAGQDPSHAKFGSAEHLTLLTRVMDLTNRARIESRLHEALDEIQEAVAAARLLDPDLLAAYAREVAGHAASRRGTTHLSVVDAAGNVAALSMSNGEGCGIMLPGSGIMLNNMLGEEDLNPLGFHVWPQNSRISSMMSPSLAFLSNGSLAALGSGGSNRIRTAILQVLINLIHYGQDAGAAVDAPRLHFEDGLANLEVGFGPAAREAVAKLSDRIMDWPPHSFFFGGVHTVTRTADGRLAAAGDPRRRGIAVVV